MQQNTKPVSSRASITGIFVTLVLILGLPLVVLITQERQDIRQRAQENDTKVKITQNGYISGYAYTDANRNGERESNEYGAVGINLIITQTDKNIVVTTDANGYFKYNLENAGNYIIRLQLPDGYKTLNVNPKILSNLNPDSKEILEFGIFPAQTLGAEDYNNTVIPTPTIFYRSSTYN